MLTFMSTFIWSSASVARAVVVILCFSVRNSAFSRLNSKISPLREFILVHKAAFWVRASFKYMANTLFFLCTTLLSLFPDRERLRLDLFCTTSLLVLTPKFLLFKTFLFGSSIFFTFWLLF
eukprot:11888.XXX_159114_159476_1 [CDS] Oithona nana genome sequencing.